MGRIGYFVNADNPGASDAELIDRDRLAHELMYFSRANPVVYYGDEQGSPARVVINSLGRRCSPAKSPITWATIC